MAKDYSQLSKEELLSIIERLESRKKYGLIWEGKPEDIAERSKVELPILKEVKKLDIETSESNPKNILIEGDNYHALSVLNFTHTEKIDAIYIDPPYNTGAKNWVYNNDYVDGNDAFRHSKWLSFMEKRLKLAKPLLKEDGIIVITIDDYEIATLRLLMDEIFGEENYLGTVIIKNNPQGRSSVSGFQVSHEYALFYSKSPKAKIGRLPRTQEQIDRYKESDEHGSFEWRNFRAQYSTESPRMKYPIFVKKDCSDFRIPKLKWNSEKQAYDLLEKPKVSEIITLPVDPNGRERTWKWSIETVQSVKDTEMGVRLDIDKNPAVYYKGRMKDDSMLPYTIWDKSDYSASALGANLLTSILGSKKFDYPKSLYAVIDTILVATEKKDATVLDFFAGSGTTGHAVLELNNRDGGNRSFILCTNNENNIAEEVTYERLKRVIKGYKNTKGEKVEGFGGNLKYFKTAFVKKSASTDNTKLRLANECTEMLCLREGVFDELKSISDYKIFKQNDKIVAIYYSLERDALKDLKKELDKLEGVKTLYCFTLDPLGLSKSDFIGWNDVILEPIPQKILDVYKQIYEY
jgi:adenine-specific DNA-methyltransferase